MGGEGGEREKKREGLRRRVEKLERKGEKESEGEGMEEGRKVVERKVRELERWREIEERERRKRNVIVKGVEVQGEGIEGAVRRIWKEIGAEAEIEETREIGKKSERGRKMILVKLKDREGKREVMSKKRALRGRMERIEDDLTMKERRMQWRLERMTEEERRNKREVWVKYARIWIEGKWWSWDEEREVLVDREGRERGKEKEERRGRVVGEEREGNGIEEVGK
ncbi:hypothetical protein X777_03726 [Ooceraea biroi]|uniref:Uncharacterized protein n=1 Tax=Ooceraea biroi TaxID=2015173 RepID=A0A026WJI7_OOCBI|nr:hypothetical protein X777_03726 [Ooceraea biroi]